MSRAAVLALLLVSALAGRASAQTITFAASLDALQTTPPSASAAGGKGTFTLSANGTLHATVTACGLGGVDAHIHKGAPGVPGGIIMALAGGPTVFSGTGILSAAQQADLFAGLYYVDIHTPANPAGEIRGQIRFSPRVFGAHLDGLQQVPSNLSAATGGATVILQATGTLACSLKTTNLLGTAAQIHIGVPGTSGALVLVLSGGPMDWSGTSPALSFSQIAALQAGGFYADLHTASMPGGEIRGQLLPAKPCVTFADSFDTTASWTSPPPEPLSVSATVAATSASGPTGGSTVSASLASGLVGTLDGGTDVFVPGTLTSLPGLIDLTGRADVVLSFSCNDATPGADQRFVEFSNNGFASANLGSLQLGESAPSPGINACAAIGQWHKHVVAGTLTAAGGPNVQMRFRCDALHTGTSGTQGWFVDDVKIKSGVPCLGDDCDCDDDAVPLDENGEPVLPEEATEVTDEQVDADMGLVEDLYPDADTSLDLWYDKDPCDASIGQQPLPAGAGEPDLAGELAALGITGVTAAEMNTQLAAWEDEITAKVLQEPNLLASPFVPPATPGYTAPAAPHPLKAGECYVLGGRDLVFVHGLQLGHVMAKIAGNPGANTKWKPPTVFPGSIENPEFYDDDGYFKSIANKIWKEHIDRFLKNKGIKNRYLIVPYSCAERLEVAAQSVLTQIGDAMRENVGVKDPLILNQVGDPPAPFNFGTPSFVILSHSTGGPVVDVAMSVAASNPALKAGFIPQHCKAHIALHGALSGSRLATAAVVGSGFIAYGGATLFPWLCPLVSATIALITHEVEPCPILLVAFGESILVDLVPGVTQAKWGDEIDTTPVRTVTVIGGHPSFLFPLKTILLPGFDDGVANINSQAANPNSALFWPSGYIPQLPPPYSWILVFDTGVWQTAPNRALFEFAEQVVDPILQATQPLPGVRVAGGATPWVSPTGMLQPVGLSLETAFGGIFSTLSRYENHFSFLESASDHFGPNGSFGGFNGVYYKDTLPFTADEKNWEETRVLTDDRIYDPYDMIYPGDNEPLLTEGLEPKLRENVRGRLIQFKLFGHKFRWWVWKRRYHLLANSQTLQEMDYVYRYLLTSPGVVVPCDPDWVELGCELPGIFGVPHLEGTGALVANNPVSLDLSNAAPNATAVLFSSFASTPVPFKGGTLCAVPFVAVISLVTSFTGTVHLAFTWPPNIPSDIPVFAQMVIADSVAVQGFAISNMVSGVTE